MTYLHCIFLGAIIAILSFWLNSTSFAATNGPDPFRVTCTGSPPTDTSLINDAIADAMAAGVRVVTLSPGVCRVDSSVRGAAGVMLDGQGGAGYGMCRTTILWAGGTTSGAVVSYNSEPHHQMVRPGLAHLCIDGNGKAAIGFSKRGVHQGEFADLEIRHVTSRGVLEQVAEGANQSDMFNSWDDVSVVVNDSQASCWEIATTVPDWDVANNTYRRVTCLRSSKPVGFLCGNSDGNHFVDFNDDALRPASASFVARAGTTTATSACRETTFSGNTAMVGGLHVEGGRFPAFGINVDFYKVGDGEPPPVFDPGSYGNHYTDSYGDQYGYTIHGIDRNQQANLDDRLPTASCGAVQRPGSANAFVVGIAAPTSSCKIVFARPLRTWPICEANAYRNEADATRTPVLAAQVFTGDVTSATFVLKPPLTSGAMNVHCF